MNFNGSRRLVRQAQLDRDRRAGSQTAQAEAIAGPQQLQGRRQVARAA